jgi:hypothetical protein
MPMKPSRTDCEEAGIYEHWLEKLGRKTPLRCQRPWRSRTKPSPAHPTSVESEPHRRHCVGQSRPGGELMGQMPWAEP